MNNAHNTQDTVAARVPRVDVLESDSVWLFVFDVPGAIREQTEVALDAGDLLVRAGVPGVTGSDGAELAEAVRWERRMELPRGVDDSQVQAQLDGGVLRVTVARSLPSRRIAVA